MLCDVRLSCKEYVYTLSLCVCMYREYSEMVSVRRVDFSEDDRPKNLKMAKKSEHPLRSSPQLMNEVVH